MNYYAFILIVFLLLSMLVLRQKMKTDLKRESFELERSILKDNDLMKRRIVKIKSPVHKHAKK